MSTLSRDLLILGASNEIMTKSYVKHVSGRNIVNASVGGSSSVAGIVMLDLHKIPEHSYCLLNYELPEHGIVASGIRTEWEIRETWKTLIEKSWSRNACPIIVTLPRQDNGKLVRSSTCDTHIGIAAEYGVPFLDGSRLFTTLYESGVPAEDLMVDVAHLSDKSHKVLGEALNGFLAQFDATDRIRWKVTTHESPFHIVWAKDLNLGESVQKQSSLSKGNMRELRDGDQIEFSLPAPGFEFMAVSVNRMSFGAALKAPGLCKHIIYDQAGLPGFMRVIVDVRALPVDGNVASFSLSPIESSPPTETTVYLRKPAKILPCGLEVECFIFRNTRASASQDLEHDYLPLPDLDLLGSLGADFVARCRDKILS